MSRFFLGLLFIISTLTFSAWAQDDQEPPKAKWHVNKQYDEEGNLIAYDSVYTWSSDSRHSFHIDIDSIRNGMKFHFLPHMQHFFMDDFPFEMHDPFFFFFDKDSLKNHKGFDDHLFFFENGENEKFQEMREKIDSIKQHYFKEIREERQKMKSGKI